MAANRTVDSANRYGRIIERVFLSRYTEGATEVGFDRSDIAIAARDLRIALPKNLGDVVCSFRYRTLLPATVRAKAPPGADWTIRGSGRGRYRFVAGSLSAIVPRSGWAVTRVPDATPGIIAMHALNDEQALLARLRYNRLIDIFTGLTCYSLQSHLRTAVAGIGQVETDELYVGIDRIGVQYVIPVQAKGSRDRLNIVQVEQDAGMAAARFTGLVCRPVAAQFVAQDTIAMFEFEESASGLVAREERHYRLVDPEELTEAELKTYRRR